MTTITFLALLLQAESGAVRDASTTGVLRFFAAFLLILTIYSGAWLFTYWISKDD